jgi:hypothetical protein
MQSAGQDDFLFSKSTVEDALDLAAQIRRIQLESPGDTQLVGSSPEQIGGAALAEQKSQGAQQQRFARAGFAGPSAESRLQLDAHIFDQCQVLHS